MARRHAALLVVTLLHLTTDIQCQLDTRRDVNAEDLSTDIPSMSAIFSTLLPNLDRNNSLNVNSSHLLNSTSNSVSGVSVLNKSDTGGKNVTTTESPPPQNTTYGTAPNRETVEVNLINPLIDFESSNSSADLTNAIIKTALNSTLFRNSTVEPIYLTTSAEELFSPSVRFSLSDTDFRQRSGLVEDIYDYANDFGERASHPQARSSSPHTATLPSLYLRDQPEDLVPFEDLRRGSPPSVRPSSLPTADWQPNWPSDLVPTPVPVRVRDRTPIISEDVPSVFHSPEPTTVEIPIKKEPVTQYFFDLEDANSHSLNLPTPSVSRSNGVATVPPDASVNIYTPNDTVTNRFSRVTTLHPSLLASEDTLSSTSTPHVTPGIILTTGIDINKIYSSAFFPSALPTAIHTSNTDTSAIRTVNNHIGNEHEPLPEDLDGVVRVPNDVGIVSVNTASSVYVPLRNNTPDYTLGSDSDYIFPSSTGADIQDLEFPGHSGHRPLNTDELSNEGSFPSLPFALPTAISNSLSSTAVPSRVRNSTGTRKPLNSKTKSLSAESRKPLWMLLSKTDASGLSVTPTPSLHNTEYGTDFPVGILSNRVPIHKTVVPEVSSLQVARFEPSMLSTDILTTPIAVDSTTSPILSPSHVERFSVKPTIVNTISATSESNSVSLVDDTILTSVHKLNETPNLWVPLVNETTVSKTNTQTESTGFISTTPLLMPSSITNVDPELTGGFTPLLTAHDDVHSSTGIVNNVVIVSTSMNPIVNVTAQLEEGFAPIAPTNIFAHNSESTISGRFDFDSALLHNVAESIVPSVHSVATFVVQSSTVSFLAPSSTFGDDFTFKLTSPYSSSIVESSTTPFSSAVLHVTPKSTGFSGVDENLPKTTPFPVWFGRPFDYNSFEKTNPTTDVYPVTEEDSSYQRRKPTTYVYPQEFLVTQISQTEENGDLNFDYDTDTPALLDVTETPGDTDMPGDPDVPDLFDVTDRSGEPHHSTFIPLDSSSSSTTSASTTSASTTTTTASITATTSSTTTTPDVSYTTTEEEIGGLVLIGHEEAVSSVSSTTQATSPSAASAGVESTTTPAAMSLSSTSTTSATTAAATTSTTAPSTTTTTTTFASTTETSDTSLKQKSTDTPPELTTIRVYSNGTREFTEMPFVRVLVGKPRHEFCKDKPAYAQLFALWLQEEVKNEVLVNDSDIRFFGEPHCDDIDAMSGTHIGSDSRAQDGSAVLEQVENHTLMASSVMDFSEGSSMFSFKNDMNPESNSTDERAIREPAVVGKENEGKTTNAFFYVSKGDSMNVDLIEAFPLFPQQVSMPAELQLLSKSVLQLELVRPRSYPSVDPNVYDGGSDASSGVTTAGIIGIVVCLALLLVTVLALVFFMMYRRKRAADNSYGKRCTPVSMDAYSVDSVSVYHSFRRRKSRANRSNRSVKSYLNQGFEDPNGPSRPLDFAQLTHFISDRDGVHEEFGTIPVVSPSYDDLPPNVQDKNRYANVIPAPETRVLLKGFKDSPSKQYINANYVRGPHNESHYYIATQAPLDNTVGDFWRMVWEQEARVVVMLTDFVERGIDKCADYLPPSQTLDCHRVYGDFQVTLKSRDMQEKYMVSGVLLKNLENNLTRDISHLWFTGWPPTGVPNTEKQFISFVLAVRRSKKQLRAKGPIVVHCSPGTGRTGTFLCCDHCMKQFEEERTVDVPKTVYHLRRERAGAVQTSDQYSFIYRVINLYASKLSSGNLDSL